MSTPPTPGKSSCKILYVDDELLSLKYFEQIVGEDFEVITAPSAEEGLRIVERHHQSIAVVVSDQRLRGLQGTTFLTQLREKFPDIVRILATAYADIATAIAAINDGAIYHYISKPWEPEALVQTLRRAMEYHQLRAEKDRLLQERSALMRQLIASDRLAGFGALAEGMNHHLRNALVPVQTYLQLAVDSHGKGAKLPAGMDESFLSELHESAKTQLRRITDTLTRLASVPSLQEMVEGEYLDLNQLWYAVIEQLSGLFEDKHIAISYTSPPDLPAIQCNRNRLSHILRLVLEDELDHLPPNSVINIAVRHAQGSGETPEHVAMEVTDSGTNIPANKLSTVFTPFFMRQENPQYLGMNLATCYVTLHNQGGWARAFNDASRGTVVELCLPVNSSGCRGSKVSMDVIEKVMEGIGQ
ncbi:hybrid sensor histidine kinase/response regulator [Verrucomicrobium sp. BvORR106]|uniref:hybrid sensor histidine kinase/response regulator n=1 Tax=Verrucomicrobium sp. BvORR106 TaxID=1403819 RepID=UPI000690FF5D|nr:hybrid sensor histidine kinase/response regulator [Verrucomicrobium sp. BvORR106]